MTNFLFSANNPKGNHSAKTSLQFFCKQVRRMAFQPRIKYFRYIRMRLEKFCNCQCIRFMLPHPDAQRFYSTQDEPGIEGTSRCAESISEELKAFAEFCRLRNNRSATYTGMTIQPFRRRMHDNICSEFEW